MNKNNYVVKLSNGLTVFVRAFNEREATILSQAIMIKNAYTYDVEIIMETRYSSDAILTDFCV